MKRIVSCILVVSILLSLFSVAAFAEGGKCSCDKAPLVYVIGRQEVYDDPTAENPVNAVHKDKELLLGAVKEALPYLAKAVVTDKWDEYCNKLVEVMKPVFENYKLNDEGEVENSSGCLGSWAPGEVWDNHQSDSVYSYSYPYDPRLDPWEIADDLNAYIQEVKRVTGHNKVALFSRCIGSAIAMAYLVKYGEPSGYEDISCYSLYNGTIGGVAVADAFFTGNISFDSDAIERYADERLGTDALFQFLKMTIALFNKTYALDLGILGVEKLYSKIKRAFPEILLDSYATCPSYWSMLSPDKFEAAKEFVFGNKAENYPVLINKIDRFHDKVQVNVENILKDMKAKGVNISIICKYGSQIMPITAEAGQSISDNLIELSKQSYGATSSDITKTLSAEYLSKADKKFISPDKQIDASTGLFPEYTWFIKDVAHFDFPDGISKLLVAFARSKEQMTVDSNELYPQYLLYDYGTDSVSPLTEENCNTHNYNKSILSRFISFITALLKLIKEKIGSAVSPKA